MENKPFLEKAVFTFSQEGNTNGTTSQYEELEITMESACGSLDDDGGFYVIRTSTGWSFNDLDEIKELFNQIKNINF